MVIITVLALARVKESFSTRVSLLPVREIDREEKGKERKGKRNRSGRNRKKEREK